MTILSSPTGWLLQTRRTAYMIQLNDQGIPQNVYWGARLPYPLDYVHTTPWRNMSFGAARRDEFPVWGDYQFNEPCLKVRFHDGVRGG
jgi:alpha-galactosidase